MWWRDLKEIWRFEGWKRNFEDNFFREVENGREIILWEDKWLGNEILKDKFPRLFFYLFWQGRQVVARKRVDQQS